MRPSTCFQKVLEIPTFLEGELLKKWVHMSGVKNPFLMLIGISALKSDYKCLAEVSTLNAQFYLILL